MDSTPLTVWLPQRRHQHRLVADGAQSGQPSTGWFLGFTLHGIVKDQGPVLNGALTSANVEDSQPGPGWVQDLFGKRVADRGYSSKKRSQHPKTRFDLQLITKRRSNMKKQPLPKADTRLLRKRAMIETITDQLKHIAQIEHTRHRRPGNFRVRLLGGLMAYCHQPKKPTLKNQQASQIQDT